MTDSRATVSGRRMLKADFETLAHFRYQLRRYLRFSEEITSRKGITPLQYQLMLQIKGFPGREWATVGELAERLQAKHHGVVSLISRCVEAGLMKRSVSASDRRRVEVHLTRKGNQSLEQLARLHRLQLLSLQGTFAVPAMTALVRDQAPAIPGAAGRSAMHEGRPARAARTAGKPGARLAK